MKRIAHRGLSGLYPENTLAAFEAALACHPDAMELDVQLTRDGQVVIFHDETLDRMGLRPGWLKDCTYDELQSLPVAVPRLSDYFELIRGVQIDTFVEFKNSFVLYPGLEEKTLKITDRYGRTADCVFYSANHRAVAALGEKRPGLRLCFPFNDWIFDEGAYCQKHGITEAIPYHLALAKEIVEDFHAHGVRVYPWTVDDPVEMLRQRQLGVDGLLTNRVDLMNQTLGGDLR